MAKAPKSIVILPARLASVRLPDKPLADIHGQSMIEHVWRRGCEAGVGDVVVASADVEICDVIERAGGRAVLTDPNHPSGSDRIFEALQLVDPNEDVDIVVNLQGDLPILDPGLIRVVIDILADTQFDVSTLVAPITEDQERINPNVVKAVVSFGKPDVGVGDVGKALYFSRATVPHGDGPLYHHIGIYGYRRAALAHFVGLPPSPLETAERLEQLRALENGMSIGVGVVDTIPFGVDTPEDLEKARRLMK